jgi:Cysteine-rich CWC
MKKHEEKNCPRCHVSFECKVGDIAHCDCYSVKLSGEETVYISEKFTDCICAACIKEMKTEYCILQSKLQLKAFLKNR